MSPSPSGTINLVHPLEGILSYFLPLLCYSLTNQNSQITHQSHTLSPAEMDIIQSDSSIHLSHSRPFLWVFWNTWPIICKTTIIYTLWMFPSHIPTLTKNLLAPWEYFSHPTDPFKCGLFSLAFLWPIDCRGYMYTVSVSMVHCHFLKLDFYQNSW